MSDDIDSRGRKPRVSIPEIRDALREADELVMDTGELADLVGLSRRALNGRMDAILDDDSIQSKVVGGTRVFWHVNLRANKAFSDIRPQNNETLEEEEIDATIGNSWIDNLDLPGEGEALKLQRAAIWWALKIIEFNGKIRSRDLRRLIWNYPYTKAYPSLDGFWNNIISPNLSKYEKESNGEIYFEKEDNAWCTAEWKRNYLEQKSE